MDLEKWLCYALLFIVVHEVSMNFLTTSKEVEIDSVIIEETASGKWSVVTTNRKSIIFYVK